jgi:hypothetical protein
MIMKPHAEPARKKTYEELLDEARVDMSTECPRCPRCPCRTCVINQILGRFGAGDGNRTHVSSLGSCSSTIELHPPGAPTVVALRAVRQLPGRRRG